MRKGDFHPCSSQKSCVWEKKACGSYQCQCVSWHLHMTTKVQIMLHLRWKCRLQGQHIETSFAIVIGGDHRVSCAPKSPDSQRPRSGFRSCRHSWDFNLNSGGRLANVLLGKEHHLIVDWLSSLHSNKYQNDALSPVQPAVWLTMAVSYETCVPSFNSVCRCAHR